MATTLLPALKASLRYGVQDRFSHVHPYLQREGWVSDALEQGVVEPLQGVNGLKFARVPVLPEIEPPVSAH